VSARLITDATRQRLRWLGITAGVVFGVIVIWIVGALRSDRPVVYDDIAEHFK